MQYFSLKSLGQTDQKTSFSEAVIHGQALDGGLYFPDHCPDQFHLTPQQSLPDIATSLLFPFLQPEFNEADLQALAAEVFQFPIPLKHLHDDLWVLELFHGPTGAFKDVGARFLARVMQKIAPQQLTILVATSGDTGGAVADGFYGIEGIEVIILYPKDRVSFLQEKQLTTLGGNIRALEIEGSFDDCQALVKAAFKDLDLKQSKTLTSANSINIARWLPQSVYYAWAVQQLRQMDECFVDSKPYFVVPSGNLGNLAAGILAWKRGLASQGFLAACNRNAVFHEYLETGHYHPQKSVLTPSNAMDVGDPSNRPRIDALFHTQTELLPQILHSATVSDEDTLVTMKAVEQKYSYLLCPHTAVGYSALQKHCSQRGKELSNTPKILLATAHPAKFSTVVKQAVGKEVIVPDHLKKSLEKTSYKTTLPAEFSALKAYLLKDS